MTMLWAISLPQMPRLETRSGRIAFPPHLFRGVTSALPPTQHLLASVDLRDDCDGNWHLVFSDPSQRAAARFGNGLILPAQLRRGLSGAQQRSSFHCRL